MQLLASELALGDRCTWRLRQSLCGFLRSRSRSLGFSASVWAYLFRGISNHETHFSQERDWPRFDEGCNSSGPKPVFPQYRKLPSAFIVPDPRSINAFVPESAVWALHGPGGLHAENPTHNSQC
jgi:hypothetical protein